MPRKIIYTLLLILGMSALLWAVNRWAKTDHALSHTAQRSARVQQVVQPIPKEVATPAPTTHLPLDMDTPTSARTADLSDHLVYLPTPTPEPTPTPTPQPEHVRFAVIGDFGLDGLMMEDVSYLVKGWEPDFVITTGDNNYPDGSADTIDANIGQYYHEFIYPYQGTYGNATADEAKTTNRFFPVLGNHDLMSNNGQAYYDYFTLPGNERYYTFTWGNMAFFMLNSMPGEPDGIDADSVQAAWLQEQLAASDVCWKLVVFHHPPYTSDSRGPYDWMRWPFAAWGADMVLNGHHHTYERLIIDGFPYFVNGLGGGPRYAFGDIVEGSEMQYNLDHGAMLVDATATQMTFQFISRLEEVIDTYTIEKVCQMSTFR